jgi:lysophospholipase L1-like esterase
MRAILFFVCAAMAWAEGNFYLKDGDTVVFYGDSITDQRLYTTFAETYVVTRFPGQKVTFVHSGWGGDRVSGGGGGPIDLRLERDVFAYKPTVMTIMLGMNDGSYQAFSDSIFETYANGYRHILESVKANSPGTRVTVIEPSPFDDVTRPPGFPGGYNGALVRYGQFLKEVATARELGVADLNTPVVNSLKRANDTDSGVAQKIIPDRVHPGGPGHLLMAAALLKAWNAPSLVSAVHIDAAKEGVLRSENATVTGLDAVPTLHWTQIDQALPLPIDMDDPVMALAVRSSDVEQALNSQPLRITGLKLGLYGLKIDGASVGNFTADQLASGINLAMLITPMTKQAAEVHALTLKHNNIHFARWRSIQVPLEKDAFTQKAQAMAALDALEQDVVAQQRAVAQPKPHAFELVRVVQ